MLSCSLPRSAALSSRRALDYTSPPDIHAVRRLCVFHTPNPSDQPGQMRELGRVIRNPPGDCALQISSGVQAQIPNDRAKPMEGRTGSDVPDHPLTKTDLDRELDELGKRYPRLKRHELFVAWFVRATAASSEAKATESLTGPSAEKNLDAVLIDDSN